MIAWFAGHPTAANLLLVVLVAAGLFAAPTLKRETFPDFQPKEVGIDVVYRGATATDVEDAVCRRLIEALKGLEHLDELACVAQDHLARATATMAPGGDIGRFLDDIRTEVEAIDDLPARAEAPVLRELHRSDLVAAVAVTGPMSTGHLQSYARQLQDRLLGVPGVSAVDIKGFSQRQFQIEIPRAVLRQHGLSAEDVAALVARQNVDLPVGLIESREREVLIRFTDERRSPAALEELVVAAGESGGELTLGQIAVIRDDFERAEERILYNGRRAAVLEVRKARAEDALDVLEAVQAILAAERARLPATVELTVTQDMTTIVRDRLEMLVKNGVLGLLLVLGVMSVFFRPRLAFWAAMGLPVAFLGAFVAMVALGLSINMITLVALLMATGIVMDDAIVITDSVAAQARAERGALDAVVAGTRRVLPGVLSSFLTTVAVFGPLAFLAGELGAVLEVLPVVLIAALAASLIEAFLILPHHLKGPVARLRGQADSRLRQGFEAAFTWLRERALGRGVDWAVRRRYFVLAAVLVLLAGSAGYVAGGHLGREAMPEIDGNVLEARILLPQGAPLERTEAVVERVSEALHTAAAALAPLQPGGAGLVRSVQVRFGENLGAGESGPHVATLSVDLLRAQERGSSLDEVKARWRAAMGEIPGLVDLVLQEPGIGPQGIAIEIRIKGEDLEEMKRAAETLSSWIAGYRGAHNVTDDLRPGKPELRLALAPGAHALGLTAEELAGQLRSAFLGRIAGNVQVGPEAYEIQVRLAAADRAALDDLEDFTVSLPDGRQVPLAVVARSESGRGWARITRVDGERTVTVQADVDGRLGNAQAMVEHTRRVLLPELQQRHPGLRFEFEGQSARAQETAASIRRGFFIGLIGIFVVLAFQFRSYSEPLIVMLAIPLAFLGALWGHVLMGYNLSMPSLVGAASLAGIVVNNSILLVQFIKGHVAAGMDLVSAAGQASRDRFRAILVSSFTTIAGLLPLLAETSTQAQVLKPLVISVAFGLLASTLLVLLVIPSLYAIVHDLGLGAAAPGRSGTAHRAASIGPVPAP